MNVICFRKGIMLNFPKVLYIRLTNVDNQIIHIKILIKWFYPDFLMFDKKILCFSSVYIYICFNLIHFLKY